LRRSPRPTGFTLIEALVALAIAAVTLTAIFQLQVQMARSQQRAQAVLAQVALQENALALIRDINVMERPEGQISLPGGDMVRWSATAVGEKRRNVTEASTYGRYEVQMFEVAVEIVSPGRRSPPALKIERLGWRRLDTVDAVSGQAF